MSTKKYYATEEYVADAIAGLSVGTGGGVLSWNDLADKPFYKEIVPLAGWTWELKGIETAATEDGFAQCEIASFPYPTDEVYEKYYEMLEAPPAVVELNGVAYSGVDTNFYDSYVRTVGDNYNLSSGNWPFVIVGERYGSNYLRTAQPGVYDVKFYFEEKSLKTIDTEFLPEGYPKISYSRQLLVNNTEVVVDDSGSSECTFNMDFVVGQTYIVTFDGETYEYVCYNDAGILTIGDYNNDPFRIWCNEYGETGISSTSGTHTIIIEGLVGEITPIDKKFVTSIVSGDYIEDYSLAPDATIDDALHKIINDTAFAQIKYTFENRVNGIIYGGGKYLYTAYQGDTPTNIIYYSDDAVNWNEASLPTAQCWRAMTYGNGIFVLFGTPKSGHSSGSSAYTTILYSSDGINWQIADHSMVGTHIIDYCLVTYVNGRFIATSGSNGYDNPIYSIDGAKWFNFSAEFASIDLGDDFVYGNDMYMRCANGSAVYISTNDCVTWSTVELNHNRLHLAFGGDKFVVISGNSKAAMYSYNGTEWFDGVLPDDYTPNTAYKNNVASICYTGTMFIAETVYTSQFLYSEDGITWKAANDGLLAMESDSAVLSRMQAVEGNAFATMYDYNDSKYKLVEVSLGNPFGLVKESDIKDKYATKEWVEALIGGIENGTY